MTENIQLERRVPNSEFEPTWRECLAPFFGAQSYAERTGEVVYKERNSPYANRYSLRVIWGMARLFTWHVAEVGAVAGTVYYFSR